MKNLNEVTVMFADSKYNYTTNVSAQATQESCKAYFVGKPVNLGKNDKDNMQMCTGIHFTDNNA